MLESAKLNDITLRRRIRTPARIIQLKAKSKNKTIRVTGLGGL
jgi:hypothetical protein